MSEEELVEVIQQRLRVSVEIDRKWEYGSIYSVRIHLGLVRVDTFGKPNGVEWFASGSDDLPTIDEQQPRE